MEKSEIQKLITEYDYSAFMQLSPSEWYTITNGFECALIEDVLYRLNDSHSSNCSQSVIERQLAIFNSIGNAYKKLHYDIFGGNSIEDSEVFENSSYYTLQIRAGKYQKKRLIDMPTQGDNTPDYEALQSIISDYASVCQQMKGMISELQTNAVDSSKLMVLLKEKEKELEKYKNLEKDLQAFKEENKRQKMELDELKSMSKKLAKKAEHEVLIEFLRTYMHGAKNKNAKKRGDIKMVITEMAQSARLTLPEDMLQELDNFDDDNTLDRPTIGEYVAVKHVENEIQNVEAGGTGVVKHLNAGNDGY